DARMLAAGAAPATYGALLIDVAERVSPLRANALALVDESSHLNQRILAMNSHRPRFAAARGILAASLGSLALLPPCEPSAPPPVQGNPADPATTAEASKQLLRIRPTDSTVSYWIDGVQVTPVQARTVVPERVASIDVRRDSLHGPEVHIALRPLNAAAPT